VPLISSLRHKEAATAPGFGIGSLVRGTRFSFDFKCRRRPTMSSLIPPVLSDQDGIEMKEGSAYFYSCSLHSPPESKLGEESTAPSARFSTRALSPPPVDRKRVFSVTRDDRHHHSDLCHVGSTTCKPRRPACVTSVIRAA